LISEYAFFTRAEKEFFPMRNRIVAGLCDALIVVETAKRGGSMITAHLANSYDRDVFALPGRIQDRQSQGCNLLIKSHRAGLIEGVEDLAYSLGWDYTQEGRGIQQELFANLSEEEKNVVDLLRDREALSRDQIMYRLPEGGAWLSNTLLTLEFKGLIKTLPGQRFRLK
jgi:DNA processing protein